MPILGRKPSGDDIGFGELWGGNSRASIMGRPSVNGWATLIGGRLGYGGSSAVTMQLGLYRASGGTVTGRLATSPTFTVNAYMRHAAGGATYERAFSGGPVQVYAKYDYAIAAATHGGGLGSFGQDHSGWPMHDRVAILPSPYSASTVSAQGRMSLWINISGNRAPSKPINLTPAPGSITSDSTPTIGASFRDPDEILPGYSLGQCDKMSAYRLEVLNQAKTSRLFDTGKVTADSSHQTARRAEATSQALEAGVYVARATFWDQFDAPSPQAEWTFTVNAGGTVADIEWEPAAIAGEANDVAVTTRDGSPDQPIQVGFTWTHSSALSANRFAARLVNQNGAVIRAETEWALSLASGGTAAVTIGAAALAGWAAMTRGQRYRLEIRGRDTTGVWSPWSASPPLIVNASPNVPIFRAPLNTVVVDPPTLTCEATDANDAETALTVEFAIRKQGTTGDGVLVPQARLYRANDRWYGTLTTAEMPNLGVYEWRVRALDPWGAVGEWSTWLSFTYASAPVVTITTPGAGSTIGTGTPAITGTVDKAIVSYSVTIRTDGGASVLSTGDMTTGGTSFGYNVPAAMLRHNTTYDATVEVFSTEGLRGRSTVRFTVQYPQPAALTNVHAEPIAGPHEPDADPSQWSRIVVTFDPATLAEVSEDEYRGTVIRRVDLGTGESLTLAVLPSRDDTVFIDRTPRSGVAYRYDVSYLAMRNTLDVVESVTAGAQAFVTLRCTVLTSMDDDDLHIPLRHWSKRKVDWIGDEETETAIGLEKPIAFRGATDYTRLRGTWTALDDPHGTYTARDLVAEMRRMKRYRVTDGGELAPRIVLYRDPRRSGFYVITSAGEDDERSDRVAPIDIDLTEVHATEGIDA